MSSDGNNKKQFWKRSTSKVPGSIQHVYGAQHPPFDPLLHANLIKAGPKPAPVTPGGKPKKATTFQEFESITSDAWEVGDDDDDELLAMAAHNLNIEVVMETANKVIENHSKQQERQRRDDETERQEEDEQEEEEEEEATAEEEEEQQEEGGSCRGEGTEEEAASTETSLGPHGDSRLVKSHSEAPIGSPRDEVAERGPLHRQRSLPPRPPIIPMVARIADQNTSGSPVMTEREASRLDKFRQLLAGPHTDLGKNLPSTSTVPPPTSGVWYPGIRIDIPRMNPERLVMQPQVTEIHIDIPRTNPLIPLFQQASVQEIFERILFIWAIRHPASGYVQGINDLVTPFFVVYVFEYIALILAPLSLYPSHPRTSLPLHIPGPLRVGAPFLFPEAPCWLCVVVVLSRPHSVYICKAGPSRPEAIDPIDPDQSIVLDRSTSLSSSIGWREGLD
ncbi:unnamed protein product [Arctogadus glacialis]